MNISCSWLNLSMKLNKTKSKAVVEFDEFMADCDPMGPWAMRREAIINKMNELAPRRTAYNMWEFKNEEDAMQALFILGLKL